MASSSSLSQIAYQKIRQCLFASNFQAEQRISETALAGQLGISRTPVREAIRRLQSEGLLYQVPRSGTFVVRPDRNEIIETYNVRRALECMSVSIAVKQITQEDCGKLQLLCDEMHATAIAMRDSNAPILAGELLRRYLRADLAFHMLLLGAGGNRMAQKIVADGRVRDAVYGARTHHRTLRHVAQTWLVHARIARTVRRHDAKAAKHWLSRHIRASLRDALAAFDKRLAGNSPTKSTRTQKRQSIDTMVDQLLQSVAEPAN